MSSMAAIYSEPEVIFIFLLALALALALALDLALALEPAFNAYYFVMGSDDSWYVGEVIQKREVELDNEKKKEFSLL